MSDKKGTTKELAPSVRFSGLVVREYEKNEDLGLKMPDQQRNLVQNYFIMSNRAIESAEQKRLSKTGKWQDKVPVTWNNIDMQQLAIDAAYYSKLGFDPLQKNHLSLIPFKNNKTGKYDMTFMPGYSGLELITMKYALDVPIDVTVELTYDTDKFVVYKKSAKHPVENYDFEIPNPFNRGEITGGFAYIQYEDERKNSVLLYTLEDIEKRKNVGHGNVEFWGGEKDNWVWDDKEKKKVIKGKVQIAGWYAEMAFKTIKRAVFGGSNILIDPTKVDSVYEYMKRREVDYSKTIATAEVEEFANKGDLIDADTMEIIDADFTEIMEDEDVGQTKEPATEETDKGEHSRTTNSSEDAASEATSAGKQAKLTGEPF